MKKYFYITASAIVLTFLFVSMPQNYCKYLLKICPENSIYYVCCHSNNCTIDAGCFQIKQFNSSEMQSYLQIDGPMDSVTAKFVGNENDFNRVLLLLGVSSSESWQCGNLQVVTGSSRRVSGGVLCDGKIVNIQIAFDGTTISVGSPLIMVDY